MERRLEGDIILVAHVLFGVVRSNLCKVNVLGWPLGIYLVYRIRSTPILLPACASSIVDRSVLTFSTWSIMPVVSAGRVHLVSSYCSKSSYT